LNLTGSGYKVKSVYKVALIWSGGTGPAYDVYRDGLLLTTLTGTAHTDAVGAKGTYYYQVCEANSQIDCSNIILIDF
jgi:hypothetical protein